MNNQVINEILDRYNFSIEEKEGFLKIIYKLFVNENFQKRMEKDFPHHDEVPLGHHILADAALTYKLCQKKKYLRQNVNVELAVVIAMMHDLYTLPWQNNPENHQKKSFNAHGFRHPLEAVVNSITWYPEYFKNTNEAEIIIDGIIHHMFPLPVRRVDKTKMELKNENLYKKIPPRLKK